MLEKELSVTSQQTKYHHNHTKLGAPFGPLSQNYAILATKQRKVENGRETKDEV